MIAVGLINTINPQDIADISVLKDAAASSIYGSRAAFGVILIKTKSGKAGDFQVTYNNNFRWNSPLLQPTMLDSERFAYYFNEAAANAGQGAPFTDAIIQKIIKHKNGELRDETEWDAANNEWARYTKGFSNNNWFKEFYRDYVPSQEHNLSARGGGEKVNFYFSVNWLGQQGLMRYNPDRLDRYSVNANINAQLNKVVKMSYLTKFSRVNNGGSSYDMGLFYHNIARRWPTLPKYDPYGNYVFGNEIAHLEQGRTETVNDELIQQLQLVITPIKGWNTYVELNYKTGTNYNHWHVLPAYGYDKDGNPFAAALQFGSFWSPGQSRISESSSKWNFFTPTIYSEYSNTINDAHNFKVMVGFQSELSQSRWFSAYRDDVYTPLITAIDGTYGENDGVRGTYDHWATAGFFSRINYSYKGRYLIELTGRYDGSSRFLRDKRWNFFPSASVGWNIAQENFWKNSGLLSKVSMFKLRASYGSLGNQNIVGSLYPFYVTMPVGASNGYWLINGKPTNTASSPGLVSSLLTWERINSYNVGLDVSMFNNRLSFIFDYFYRKTFDMVGPAPQLPSTLGTAVPRMNNTDMISRGFDLEASWRDNIGEFSYGAKLTLTDSRQFVTKYPNDTKDLSYYYNGREMGQIWGYTTVGIAKTDAEMTEHLVNNKPNWGSMWAAGDVMYKDLNGDKEVNSGKYTFDDPGDLSVIGNSTPRYNFGIDLDMAWKGIDVRIFLQGTGKRDLMVGGPYFSGASNNMWQAAAFVEHLDYFRPANTDSKFGPNENGYFARPIFDRGWKNYETQTRWMQDASYIRLKNLQIGYTLPNRITQRAYLSNVRFYVSGENLFTMTKMVKIFDPETTGGGWGNGKIYPLSRVFSCGLSLTF